MPPRNAPLPRRQHMPVTSRGASVVWTPPPSPSKSTKTARKTSEGNARRNAGEDSNDPVRQKRHRGRVSTTTIKTMPTATKPDSEEKGASEGEDQMTKNTPPTKATEENKEANGPRESGNDKEAHKKRRGPPRELEENENHDRGQREPRRGQQEPRRGQTEPLARAATAPGGQNHTNNNGGAMSDDGTGKGSVKAPEARRVVPMGDSANGQTGRA